MPTKATTNQNNFVNSELELIVLQNRKILSCSNKGINKWLQGKNLREINVSQRGMLQPMRTLQRLSVALVTVREPLESEGLTNKLSPLFSQKGSEGSGELK